MLQSFDRAMWQEDLKEAAERDAIKPDTPPETIRRYFPLSALVLEDCKVYQLVSGQCIAYARTKSIPQVYPIEVLVFVDRGKRLCSLASHEVQLIEA